MRKRSQSWSSPQPRAVTSVAVSAVPGDATTPLASKIADLSSYLLLVVGAIMLEKLLLTMLPYAAFTILIPAACDFLRSLCGVPPEGCGALPPSWSSLGLPFAW
ncbi:MAG: hypothetical protein V8R75_00450 [Oscillospiraceae bacterium]